MLFRVFYGTARRLSEALNLELHDFDQARATLKIHDGMDHENRVLPVTGRLAATVESYMTTVLAGRGLDRFGQRCPDAEPPAFRVAPGRRSHLDRGHEVRRARNLYRGGDLHRRDDERTVVNLLLRFESLARHAA